MHLHDDELRAIVDGELADARATEALRHLAGCLECVRRLDRLRMVAEQTTELLSALDHARPPLSADAVIARANRVATTRHRAAAAGLAALVIAGAAAAAIPGSPVRRYVAGVLARSHPQTAGRLRQATPEASPEAASGIAVVPAARVEIVFRDVQPAGAIRISLADTGAVRITHWGGTAGYAVTDSGVVIDNAASTASYDVTIPRSVTRVRVRVGTLVVFAREGERISSIAARERGGSYVIEFPHLSGRIP